MPFAAVPAVVLLKKKHVPGATAGANHAVGPPLCNQILPAIGWLREVSDGILEGFDLHESIMSALGYFVKYIIAVD